MYTVMYTVHARQLQQTSAYTSTHASMYTTHIPANVYGYTHAQTYIHTYIRTSIHPSKYTSKTTLTRAGAGHPHPLPACRGRCPGRARCRSGRSSPQGFCLQCRGRRTRRESKYRPPLEAQPTPSRSCVTKQHTRTHTHTHTRWV